MNNEEMNNNTITEFKMYITDLETNKNSKEIDVSDLVFDDYIEFEFGNYGDKNHETLPYKDFKFFINDYSVTFYSPQMNQLQQENKQLKDNWNKLKEYFINEQEISINFQQQMGNYIIVKPQLYIETIINKMQELESGDSNE